MQHAQEYLAKVLPWPQDNDPPAYVNLHWSTDKVGNNGKPLWSGRAVKSVREAVSTVKWALSLLDVKDIYVCMSSQQEALPKISKAGNPYILPIRSQANAVAFKSLFMDLDAKGKSKDSYDTLEEALAAFTNFIGVVGLPRPNVIVKTGGGFHVYWTFDRALPIEEWQPLANALAAAAEPMASSATRVVLLTLLVSFAFQTLLTGNWLWTGLLFLLVVVLAVITRWLDLRQR